MKTAYIYTIIFEMFTTSLIYGGQTSPEKTNQFDAKQELNAYEKGEISLLDLTKSKRNCDELINYYLSCTKLNCQSAVVMPWKVCIQRLLNLPKNILMSIQMTGMDGEF